MSASSGLTLRGIPPGIDDSKQGTSSAILLKLNDEFLRDVRKAASSSQGGLHFLTGNTPKVRLGKRTIDLTLSSEAFRHELFSASTGSLGQMDFAGLLSHRAQLKTVEKRHSEGTDAALATLQNNLALAKQEKQAKAVNISSSIIAAPENRFQAAKEHKKAQRRGLLGSQPASPSLSAAGTPRLGAAPTSAPTDSAVRTKAMRTPLIHLLAMKPLTREEITQKTRIPKDDLEEVLPKVGKQDGGKWLLTDRAYKELDVYKFGYSSQEDRQAAIDNAIRAYDRMRLGKDEKIWQMLLPKEERGKGTVLSKLHLGAGAAAGRGLTPNYGASPMLGGGEASAEKGGAASASNTPRLGPSSTPKPSSGALSKTLFAKDPKKARLAEEAKERKRKDREANAGTSDREGGKPPVRKKQTTKTNNPKVKSAELVHSSDEDSVSSGASKGVRASANRHVPKAPPNERKPLPNAASATKAKQTPTATSTSTTTAASKATKPKSTNGPISRTTTTSARPSPSLSSTVRVTKPASTIGRNTPSSSSQGGGGRSQLSPQNRNSRPHVPSPLGAARPRTSSDVSTKGPPQRPVKPGGAETPKGLGISTNGSSFRKRQDTVTSQESNATSTSERMSGNGETRKPNGGGIRKPGTTNMSKAPMTNSKADGSSSTTPTTAGLKRKAQDSPAPRSSEPAATTANKHRKTESSISSHSQKSGSGHTSSSSVGAHSSVGDDGRDRSDSASSITDTITYRQGVYIARQFRDDYYPQYAKLYDEQVAMEKRGEEVPRGERQRLWVLHRRLEQMKREIRAASEREGED